MRSKRGEVSSKSSKNLHVARNPLGFGLRNAVSASRIPAQGGGEGQGNDSLLPAHKEEARVTGGSLAVCFDHRQSSVDTNQRLQQTHEVACQTKTQRPEASSSSEAEGSPQTLEEDVVLREASSTGFTSCHAYPTFRCVHSRMGGPRWEGDSIRELVPYSRQLPYQFLGVDGSLPGTSSSCSAEEPRQTDARQLSCSCVSKEGGIPFTSSQSGGSSHQPPDGEAEGLPVCGTYCRDKQCPCRRPLKGQSGVDRMVSFTEHIPVNLPQSPGSGSRHLRHTSESSTSSVRVTLPGSRCCSSRCLQGELEQVEGDFPVPPDSPDFEGFGPSEILQGEGGVGSPVLADFAFLHSPEDSSSILDSSSISSPVSDGGRAQSLQRLLSDPQPSRLDFLN